MSGHNVRKEGGRPVPRIALESRVIKSGEEAGWFYRVKVDDGKRLYWLGLTAWVKVLG